MNAIRGGNIIVEIEDDASPLRVACMVLRYLYDYIRQA